MPSPLEGRGGQSETSHPHLHGYYGRCLHIVQSVGRPQLKQVRQQVLSLCGKGHFPDLVQANDPLWILVPYEVLTMQLIQ